MDLFHPGSFAVVSRFSRSAPAFLNLLGSRHCENRTRLPFVVSWKMSIIAVRERGGTAPMD